MLSLFVASLLFAGILLSSLQPKQQQGRFVLLTLLIVMGLFSHSAKAQDPAAVHGMLVFGDKSVYLSHLPMFHSPHDYQVIMQVELGPVAMQVYLADQKAHPENRIYTFVPQPLVLPVVVAGKIPFQGDLYRGHFERGGVVIQSSVQVQITKVLYFHKFSSTDSRPALLTYLLFGDSGDYWLAHLIFVKPDFDQIAKVTLPEAPAAADKAVTVTIANFPTEKPLDEGGDYLAECADGPLHIQQLQTQYLEFDDLAM